MPKRNIKLQCSSKQLSRNGTEEKICVGLPGRAASAKAPRWECARRNSKDTRETGTRRARGGDKLREAAGQTCEAMAASDSEGRETTRGLQAETDATRQTFLTGSFGCVGRTTCWANEFGEGRPARPLLQRKSFAGGSDRRGEVEMVKSGQIWETV